MVLPLLLCRALLADDVKPRRETLLKPLDIPAIRRETRHLLIGHDLRYATSVHSTNRQGRECMDWRTGTTFMTDYQYAGKGRQGKSWEAPPYSSLLLSVLVRLPRGAPAGACTMLASLSAAEAIRRICPLSPVLKWPNDVLIGGRKCCGILAEYSPGCSRRVLLGIGINVNFDPRAVESVPGSLSTLQEESGAPVSREELAIALFTSLDLWYRVLIHRSDQVVDAWAAQLDTIGRPIEVKEQAGAWSGIALAVQSDGGLVARRMDGVERIIYAADVSIRSS